MPYSVENTVHQVLAKLERNIANAHDNATIEDIEQICSNAFEGVFESCPEEHQQALNRALSRPIHPDIIRHLSSRPIPGSQPVINYSFGTKLIRMGDEFTSIPQKALGQAQSSYKQVCTFWNGVSQYIFDPMNVALYCSLAKQYNDSPKIQSQLYYFSISPFSRYVQPIQGLAYTAAFFTMLGTAITTVIGILALNIGHLPGWWNNQFKEAMTGGEYTKQMNRIVNEMIETGTPKLTNIIKKAIQQKIQHLEAEQQLASPEGRDTENLINTIDELKRLLEAENIDTDHTILPRLYLQHLLTHDFKTARAEAPLPFGDHPSNSELIDTYRNAEIALINSAALFELAENNLSSIQRFSALGSGFWGAISANLPEEALPIIGAISFRMLQALLFVPALALEAICQLLNTITQALQCCLVLLTLTTIAAVNLTLNGPLMIYDGIAAMCGALYALVVGNGAPTPPPPPSDGAGDPIHGEHDDTASLPQSPLVRGGMFLHPDDGDSERILDNRHPSDSGSSTPIMGMTPDMNEID